LYTRLNEFEVRVIGSLIEKEVATPDYYPLTLNGLVHACNQKNNRNPVVGYDEETVTRALNELREKKLAYVFFGAESRVAKYGHLFPKAYGLTPAETALMCVLMLRGPQTTGELRGRTANLYNFATLSEVEVALEGLTTREDGALVTCLARLPGMKEPRYAHLLSGEVELDAPELKAHASPRGNDRLDRVEESLTALRQEVAELRAQLVEFRKQFE
jgi:uncharacterized protein YceH (UPF0502 family)